jgi:hypothetical protein
MFNVFFHYLLYLQVKLNENGYLKEYLMDSFNRCYEKAARYFQKTVFQIKNEILYDIIEVF